MGGEGAMMNANISLKNNRKLLSKRTGKTGLSGSYSKVELRDFPEATPQALKELREKLQRENKRMKVKQFLVLLVVIFLLILVFV